MGGRQKKKQGGGAGKKKKKPSQAQKMQPEHPEIEESDEFGGADTLDRGAERTSDATLGFDQSFEAALYDLKAEAQSVGMDARAAAEAAAMAADEDWATVDTAYEDLQRACEAHAQLWAQVDKLTPVRDEWYAKWQECDRVGREAVSLENQIKDKDISGASHCPLHHSFPGTNLRSLRTGRAATEQSKEYFAKARTLRASKKRLAVVNDQITKLTREILNLEERYPIKSKRTVDSRMREAVLEEDPTKVMAALQPDETAAEQMRKQRVEVLARECNKYYGRNGVKHPGVLPGYSKEQIDELVARGVREGADALRPQERRAVAQSIGPGADPAPKQESSSLKPGLPAGAGVVATGGGLEAAGAAQQPHRWRQQPYELEPYPYHHDAPFGQPSFGQEKTREQQLKEIEELKKQIAEVKVLQHIENAEKAAKAKAEKKGKAKAGKSRG